MLAYLKIKIISLAQEGHAIHREELKWKARSKHPKNTLPHARDVWLGLKSHRRCEVRTEARAAQLAYAFLRGKPYRSVERICYEAPWTTRIAELAHKYRDRVSLLDNEITKNAVADAVKAWLAAE